MTPPHGTYKRYDKHGCRCADCRRVNARKHNQWRSQRYKKPLPPNVKHNRNTYFNWGCGCDTCRADVNRYAREHGQRAS